MYYTKKNSQDGWDRKEHYAKPYTHLCVIVSYMRVGLKFSSILGHQLSTRTQWIENGRQADNFKYILFGCSLVHVIILIRNISTFRQKSFWRKCPPLNALCRGKTSGVCAPNRERVFGLNKFVDGISHRKEKKLWQGFLDDLKSSRWKA